MKQIQPLNKLLDFSFYNLDVDGPIKINLYNILYLTKTRQLQLLMEHVYKEDNLP